MSSHSHFEVRPAGLRDAKTIAELHLQALSRLADDGLSKEQQEALVAVARTINWREAIEYLEPQVYLACDAGTPLGFVGFDRSRDLGTPPTTGEIWAMAVLPEHWGRGLGLALWDAARDGLLEEGCNKVSIWLPLLNQRAGRFFELAGFKRELKTAKTVPLGAVKLEEIRLSRTLA